MRLLVCGSRRYSDGDRIESVLEEYYRPGTVPTVIHGGCCGADSLAGAAARSLAFDVECFYADWGRYGNAAGPIRNRQMLDTKPDLVIAFGEGKGTDGCVRMAEQRGIPVRREP